MSDLSELIEEALNGTDCEQKVLEDCQRTMGKIKESLAKLIDVLYKNDNITKDDISDIIPYYSHLYDYLEKE